MEVPKGANVVSGRWVNSWKTDGDGQVLKVKSRMVARGFSQSYGDECLEVASPTVAPPTTKITLRVAVELVLQRSAPKSEPRLTLGNLCLPTYGATWGSYLLRDGWLELGRLVPRELLAVPGIWRNYSSEG